MAKVSPEALREVQAAFEQYSKEVDESNLVPTSKPTYRDHAWQFVRWLDDDFEPGTHVNQDFNSK